MRGKSLILKLNAKMLSATHLKNYWSYKVDFLHASTYLLKLEIDNVILDGHAQACHGMLKDGIKTLRSQKLKKVWSWFCAWIFIFVKVINLSCKFKWLWSGMLRHAQKGFENFIISKDNGGIKLIFCMQLHIY